MEDREKEVVECWGGWRRWGGGGEKWGGGGNETERSRRELGTCVLSVCSVAIFGQTSEVFSHDEDGHENHVDRILNVIGKLAELYLGLDTNYLLLATSATARSLLCTTYYSLTTCYLLFTTHYSLLTTCY